MKRGGFLFVSWIGDHSPKHVHVLRDGKLVLKWDLESREPFRGKVSRRILRLIREIEREGRL